VVGVAAVDVHGDAEPERLIAEQVAGGPRKLAGWFQAIPSAYGKQDGSPALSRGPDVAAYRSLAVVEHAAAITESSLPASTTSAPRQQRPAGLLRRYVPRRPRAENAPRVRLGASRARLPGVRGRLARNLTSGAAKESNLPGAG